MFSFDRILGIDDCRQFYRDLAKASRRISEGMPQLLRHSAQSVERWAKLSVKSFRPDVIDTGRTLNSIFPVYTSKTRAEIAPKTSYAFYPHMGLGSSEKYGARPFMYTGLKYFQEMDLPKLLNKFGNKIVATIAGVY